jgi:hypothetical protein
MDGQSATSTVGWSWMESRDHREVVSCGEREIVAHLSQEEGLTYGANELALKLMVFNGTICGEW